MTLEEKAIAYAEKNMNSVSKIELLADIRRVTGFTLRHAMDIHEQAKKNIDSKILENLERVVDGKLRNPDGLLASKKIRQLENENTRLREIVDCFNASYFNAP